MTLALMTQMPKQGESKKKVLNDQQWMQQRMKIGLSATPSAKIISQSTMENLTSSGYKNYIQEHFKRKECVRYFPGESGDLCEECGHHEEEHKTIQDLNSESDQLFGVKVLDTEDEGAKVHHNQTESNHIQKFPTNAYGKIAFEGGQKAKYVRLADDTPMVNIREFMTYDNTLMKPKPHMALSIIGRASNEPLQRLREVLQSRRRPLY